MKVGIITFHCAYNFGSMLQAWALQRSIEKMNHQPYIIDYRGADFNMYKLITITRPSKFISNLVYYRQNKKRKESFENFASSHFQLTKRYSVRNQSRMRELSKEFDCVICGSDQIWNLDCTKGPVGPYFLDFGTDFRKVAYAPSLAHASFNKKYFTDKDKQYISRQLNQFYMISIREPSTANLFQPLVEKNIEICLDPTLLLNGDDYRNLIRDSSIEDPFVFAYMLENNPDVIEQAQYVAKSIGAKVVYISKQNINLSVPSVNLFGIGPSEFLDLMSRSAAVITNSFHATVFSILFATPFQTIATMNSGSRMRELLTSLGESGHLIDGVTKDIPEGVDSSRAYKKLELMRNASLEYLANALRE